jgi:tetratricopeptide (TPR) repeat protein
VTPHAKGQRLLDRFVLLAPLGHGGQGEVWRALDEQRAAQIAVKILPAGSLEVLRAQHALARAAAGRGILECFEPIGNEEVAVLPMELAAADARSLRARSWTQSLALLREVVDALADLHARGIVHRDLKPSNVLIGFDGRARLADFGAAARIGERSSARVLSPFSASPQQHAGAVASPADDLFGLGALAYELLGGYPPNFPDAEAAAAGTLPPRLATSVATPPALLDLVMALLEPRAEARPQDLHAIAATLATLESQRLTPVLAAEIVPLDVAIERGETDTSRRPSVAAWAGLAALAAALVGVFLLLPRYVVAPTPQARNPVTAPAVAATQGGAAAPAAAAMKMQVDREQAARFEEAEGKYRALLEELEMQGAGVWGGATFAAAKSLGALAAEAEAARDYVLALDRIELANQRLARVVEERPQALARQLREAETALDAGRLELARQAYELAQRIEPGNAIAGRGLARVQALGPVLPALVAAETASLTLDHLAALTRYEEVLRADPQNRVAREGAARARTAIGSDRYAREIGEALAALRAGRTPAARAALARAKALRPGGAELPALLAQIDAAGEKRDLDVVQAEILLLESGERWGDALLRYDALLARDPTLGFARSGRARVVPRAELARRLEALLANPSRLSAPEVRREAGRLLAEAGNIRGEAPLLRGQTEKLRVTLQLYDQPVLAVLESDGATLVSVQRVGNFGAFTRRELQLKPGRYVAVGSRTGFRDVRREFTITPGAGGMVIEVRCTEAIS